MRAVFYPLVPSTLPLVMYFSDFLENYDLVQVITPSGSGAAGRDVGYITNFHHVGITCTDALDDNLDNWDILLVVETSEDNESIEQEREKYIRQSVASGKQVLYAVRENPPRYFRDLQRTYQNFCRFTTFRRVPLELSTFGNKRVQSTEVPIILVGGLVEQADVFHLVMKIALQMKLDGLKPLVFTKQPAGCLLGFQSLCHIFNDPRLSESRKMEDINSYIRSCEIQERPDAIILEAPDAVMRYNNFEPNGFGIRTYMLAQAVVLDEFLCCVPCELCEVPFINSLSNDFFIRLGTRITVVHVSNIIIDSIATIDSGKLAIVHTTLSDVDWHIEEQKRLFPDFNLLFNGMSENFSELYNNLVPAVCENAQQPVSKDESPQTWLLHLLHSKFDIPEEHLLREFFDMPLTGNPFHLNGLSMTYLFLEVEKNYRIFISDKELEDYHFNSINAIIDLISKRKQRI